jgi:hypothetical protein
VSAVTSTSPFQARRGPRGRLGDLSLEGLTLAAALAVVVLVGAIVWKVRRLAAAGQGLFTAALTLTIIVLIVASISRELFLGVPRELVVEYDTTEKIFTNPSDKRTEDYVTGRFG